jgi:hypothetical protein
VSRQTEYTCDACGTSRRVAESCEPADWYSDSGVDLCPRDATDFEQWQEENPSKTPAIAGYMRERWGK